MDYTTLRGIRLNNPGNIDRDGTVWFGMSPTQPDPRFVSFTTPEYGIRALAKILISYQDTHKLNTIRAIINRWAPPVENNTTAYVDDISGKTGIHADTVINVHDFNIMKLLVNAIIAHEEFNYVYPVSIVENGITLAGVKPSQVGG